MHQFTVPGIPLPVCALLCGILTTPLMAAQLPVANPGFEGNALSNPPASGPDNFIGAAGQGITPTPVPSWTFAAGTNPDSFTAYGGVSDLAAPNHALEGGL